MLITQRFWYEVDPDLWYMVIAMNILMIFPMALILPESTVNPFPMWAWSAIVIVWSVAIWTGIGFLVYRIRNG